MVTSKTPITRVFERQLERLNSVGIDSMCFIYQFQGHPIFGPPVFSLFSRFESGKITGVTSIIALAEILSFPKLHEAKTAWEEERQKFRQIPNLKAIAVDGKICEAASFIKVKYALHLPDALQITTAIFNRADAFITNDERLRKVKEITVMIIRDYC